MRIKLVNISKSFSKTFTITDFNLEIKEGEFTTLLGPSGCGKTTILRMIAGLETPDAGEIYFDDECVFSDTRKINYPPEKRNLGFVFQDFALWPHMTVFENIAFPLRAKKQTKNLKQQVLQVLDAVQLVGYENRYPRQLSGGQQQRVAVARAIVGRPECILFDEPLSALDAILRESMRITMKQITERLGVSAVFVTHDQMEAMSMSDCIVVMDKGKIEQTGTPEEVYQNPCNRFVAKFIGKSNWINHSSMVRPEKVKLHAEEDDIEYKTKVTAVQFLGNTYELLLEGHGFQWQISCNEKKHPQDLLSVYIDKSQIVTFR